MTEKGITMKEDFKVGEVFNTKGWFYIAEQDPASNVLTLKQRVHYVDGVGGYQHPAHFEDHNVSYNKEKFDIGFKNRDVVITAIKGNFAEVSECAPEGHKLDDGIQARVDLSTIVAKPTVTRRLAAV